MTLTRRGWIVLTVACFTGAFAVGMVTANWCWFGYCGP